jgi:hypothetical protein
MPWLSREREREKWNKIMATHFRDGRQHKITEFQFRNIWLETF